MLNKCCSLPNYYASCCSYFDFLDLDVAMTGYYISKELVYPDCSFLRQGYYCNAFEVDFDDRNQIGFLDHS